MTQPVLDGACVMAFVGQRVAATVARHVGADGESVAGARADALNQAIDGIGRERSAPLRRKHKAAIGKLPALAQRPNFVAAKRANASAPPLAVV